LADYYPYLPPPTPIQGPVQTGLQVNALKNAQLDYNTKSALAPLDIATAQLNYDQANALAPLTLQARQQALTAGDISNTSAQEDLDTRTALDPYKITAAQRGDVAGQQQSDTETQNYYRSLRVDAANSALEAGDDDAAAAKIWNTKMQAAADKGDPTAAQYIAAHVDGDAVQPAGQIARIVDLPQSPVQSQEYLLRGILRILPAGEQAQRRPRHLRFMHPEQPLERRRVARLGASQEPRRLVRRQAKSWHRQRYSTRLHDVSLK